MGRDGIGPIRLDHSVPAQLLACGPDIDCN